MININHYQNKYKDHYNITLLEKTDRVGGRIQTYDDISTSVEFIFPLIKSDPFDDLNATIALSKNAQGTIINGFTRDIERSIDLELLRKVL